MSEESNQELVELKHKFRMEELEFQRTSMKLKHEWEMERLRIETAERKKHFIRIQQAKENRGRF